MLSKIKNLDPNTKLVVKAVATQIAILGATILVVKAVEKKTEEN